MERVEEFTLEGKNFVYLDISGTKTNEDFTKMAEKFKPIIAKYPENTLYTITNIDDVRFDSETKVFLADFMEHNKPYVKYGSVIGFDGIKKILANTICQMVGRTNMHFAFSREAAIEWLLRQE